MCLYFDHVHVICSHVEMQRPFTVCLSIVAKQNGTEVFVLVKNPFSWELKYEPPPCGMQITEVLISSLERNPRILKPYYSLVALTVF